MRDVELQNLHPGDDPRDDVLVLLSFDVCHCHGTQTHGVLLIVL